MYSSSDKEMEPNKPKSSVFMEPVNHRSMIPFTTGMLTLISYKFLSMELSDMMDDEQVSSVDAFDHVREIWKGDADLEELELLTNVQ